MTDFSERKKKSFDVILDTIKLLITLCTAMLGFMVSGILNSKRNEGLSIACKDHMPTLQLALIMLALSVFTSICVILKLSGILGNEKMIKVEDMTIYDKATRVLFGVTLLLFFVAILALGYLSWSVLSSNQNPPIKYII